jgi:outer membrane protein TolC
VTNRVAISCVMALLLPAVAAGQTASAAPRERLSVDAAITLALAHNPAIESAKLQVQKSDEELLALVADVKRLYFAILQTESALHATGEAIALYRELDRSLDGRVAQKVALESDVLDVRFRLAQQELTRLTSANALEPQKERLNQLSGATSGRHSTSKARRR